MNNNVLIEVTGKNINNYLKWLLNQNIPIVHLNVIKYDKLHLVVDYKYYGLLKKYSKTYKIIILKRYGKQRLIETMKNNCIIIISLFPALVLLYILSHIIFSVDIMYNDKAIIALLEKELAKYQIQKYKVKKDFTYLNKVKNQILRENEDVLEWIEIEEKGTKYIIRVVERKKETKQDEYAYQSIIAAKNAMIVNIEAYAGEKTKVNNQYVQAGEVIISGILTKPDGTNIYTKAKGLVTAEVWYKVTIEYPLHYQEEKITGKTKNIIAIYFLNHELPIFPYKKYKQFKRLSKSIIEDNLIPLKLTTEKLYEVNVKEEIYTNEEAVAKAVSEVKKKLPIKNNKIASIKNVVILNKEYLNSMVKVTLFVSTIEDITMISEVVKPSENDG